MANTRDSRIRRALPHEAGSLSKLAFRSKAYWGYSKDFMSACRRELTLSSSYVERNPTFVIESRRRLVGFYSLETVSPQKVELGYLFVEPDSIGHGYGRKLMEHAKRQAHVLGYEVIVIQGDPHAERFYQGAGGEFAGTKESASIPGRTLPLFQIDLRAMKGRT